MHCSLFSAWVRLYSYLSKNLKANSKPSALNEELMMLPNYFKKPDKLRSCMKIGTKIYDQSRICWRSLFRSSNNCCRAATGFTPRLLQASTCRADSARMLEGGKYSFRSNPIMS